MDGAQSMSVSVHVNARHSQETEYKQQVHNVAKLERLLKVQEERLALIKAGSTSIPIDEARLRQVDERIKQNDIDPRNIAPEDALDTIVRLENHLKLQQRRNAGHQKELEKARRQVKEKRNALDSLQKENEHLMVVTGWDGRARSAEEQMEMQNKMEQMEALSKRLREEHTAARLIISKKEHVVRFLLDELTKRIEQREQLDLKYNEIRVADRDNREVLEAIAALRKQDAGQDSLIIAARGLQDTVAVECLEQDNLFLQEEVRAKKGKRVEQDRVMKAQIARAKTLTNRFEVIGGCLRDLGLDIAAQEALTSVPPALDAHTEPTDMERIQPSNERLPTVVYELVWRDMANIRSAVSRKDVMAVEKQCVVNALDSKYHKYCETLRQAQQQEAVTKDDKFLEMQHLRATLAEQHLKFRKTIDEMLNKNLKLKNEVIRRANPPPPATAPATKK